MVLFRYPISKVANHKRLAEPLHFKTANVYARNRLMKAALSEQLCPYDAKNPKLNGVPEQKMFNLYEKWGVGGYGVVLTGNVIVDHLHLEAGGNSIISKETDTPVRREAFRKIATNSKTDGALAIMQLGHAGRQTPYLVNPTPFSVSDIKLDIKMRGHEYGQPIPLTKEQIKTEVIDRLVFAAKYARETGFDGVQIHGAHGYLIAAFLSPSTNNRKDEYGGSVKNRTLILREAYQAIRKEIPASTGFVIGVKLNSVEFQTGGLGVEDAIETAKIVEAEGFDFIELTGGNYEKWQMQPNQRDSTKNRESYFGKFSKAIRQELKNTVVYLTGGFRTVPGMIAALENGDTDGFGLGRPSTAEPDIARKLIDLGYQATAINWAEFDFMASAGKGSVEIHQLSKSSLIEGANDPTHGLMDLTAKPEFDAFVVKLVEYHTERQKLIDSGVLNPEWFNYDQQPAPVFSDLP